MGLSLTLYILGIKCIQGYLPCHARAGRAADHGPHDGLLAGVDHGVVRAEDEGRRLPRHDRDDDGAAGRVTTLFL